MRERLRRLATLALVPTAVDVGLLVLLRQTLGWMLVPADLVAIAVASGLSYGLHRAMTFRSDPFVRWVRMPAAFVMVAALAAVVDVVVLRSLFAVHGFASTGGLVAAKGVALAAAAIVRLVLYRAVLLDVVRRDLHEQIDRPPAPGSHRATVIIPAFEERTGIVATVSAVRTALAPLAADGLEIVVVDDGSTDGTADAALSAGADQVLALPTNRGKGAAVRAGVMAARGRTVAFTDADLAYSPDQLLRVIAEVEDGWDVALGNRRHPEATRVRGAGLLRDLGSRAMSLLAMGVLLSHPHDTQCGLKAFRSDVAHTVFGLGRVDGFAFDVEVLHLLERHGFSVKEVPVRLTMGERSTVRLVRDTLRMLGDLWRIRHWSATGAYELPEPQPVTSSAAGGDHQARRGPPVGWAFVRDLDSIFKAYDIRGTTPDQLDGDVARSIGQAFAVFASGQVGGVRRILVGRDMRESGVELAAAFSDGVRSQGLDVVDLGLASTDLVYFAAGKLDSPGAMFTASHNPAQYNGLKLCLAGAKPVGVDSGLIDIKAMATHGVPPSEGPTGGFESLDLLQAFGEHVRSFVDLTALRPLKVVADTANGMGGLVVPAVFEGLPVDLEVLYGELDGSFPNHPADPIQPENLKDLQARVLEVGADVGLAFDGDADRVFLVDELGQPLSGSTTTAIVAAGVLDKHPGATILHNCICSKAVPEVISERGGTPIRTKVGHSYIKAIMADTGAAFGGEHSAHYYFRDNWRADSGSIAALLVLEQLGKAGVPLSELRRPFDRYAASGEINATVADPEAVIEKVAAAFPADALDRLDGLTVDLGEWWFNLRASNTEPLLRLNLEAPDAATCAAKVAEVQALINAA